MNLANKVIWITGASSGIGEAITYALAKENCKLVISARRIEELKRVKANTKLSDDKILVLPIDLEQHQYAKDWTKKVTDKFNKIDVLINNGGISQEGFALNTSTQVEQKIMNISYFGNVALSKSVAPIKQQQKQPQVCRTAFAPGQSPDCTKPPNWPRAHGDQLDQPVVRRRQLKAPGHAKLVCQLAHNTQAQCVDSKRDERDETRDTRQQPCRCAHNHRSAPTHFSAEQNK